MKKITGQHMKSLVRALIIMRIHLNHQKVPKYQKELERDVKYLTEIGEYIDHTIKVPMFSQLNDTACELVV